MTKHYTPSKGEPKLIADMEYTYLTNALRKAISSEERKHEADDSYSNPEREAEITEMTAEVARRDAAYAANPEAQA